MIELARTLFACENPPGSDTIPGSQDALGIVLQWLEEHLYLLPLAPRTDDFEVLAQALPNQHDAARLAQAAEDCWRALESRDLQRFGAAMTDTFAAQTAMFPRMQTAAVATAIEPCLIGWLGTSWRGAGGRG